MARSFQNPFHAELLQGIGSVCLKKEFSVTIVSPLSGDINKAIKTAAVDGFIAVGLEEHMETYRILRDRHIPFVCIDVDTPEDIPSVTSDDSEGTHQLMNYILNQGHKKMTILSFRPAMLYHEQHYSLIKDIRLQGYFKALHQHGIEIKKSEIQVIECTCNEEGGFQTANEILTGNDLPSILICMSDIIAVGVMKYCQQKNIIIPQDISICGFDNISISPLLRPPLTTVSQPIMEKGQVAAEMLIHLMNHQKIEFHQKLNTQVIIRDSVSKI
ncbi:MAG: substrate-binding domain-containing protein [Spirochaetes bacterium]|nr:substrate-binding domain-containing protein [Spirochaetota bacterium]